MREKVLLRAQVLFKGWGEEREDTMYNKNRALLLQHSCRSRDCWSGDSGPNGWTINPEQGMTSCWVSTKNLCFSSDALSREPAMLRRWAWILHLFILNRGNGLELAYNRGSCILLPRISLGCKLVAVTYQEYECAVCLVIVSLCNRTAEERIRQNSVVCNKRDRAIRCVF